MPVYNSHQELLSIVLNKIISEKDIQEFDGLLKEIENILPFSKDLTVLNTFFEYKTGYLPLHKLRINLLKIILPYIQNPNNAPTAEDNNNYTENPLYLSIKKGYVQETAILMQHPCIDIHATILLNAALLGLTLTETRLNRAYNENQSFLTFEYKKYLTCILLLMLVSPEKTMNEIKNTLEFYPTLKPSVNAMEDKMKKSITTIKNWFGVNEVSAKLLIRWSIEERDANLKFEFCNIFLTLLRKEAKPSNEQKPVLELHRLPIELRYMIVEYTLIRLNTIELHIPNFTQSASNYSFPASVN